MSAPDTKRPWWVRLGLWKVPDRRGAWVWFWLSVVSAASCVVIGFFKPVFFILAGSAALVAFLYRAAISWVDRYDQW